jgi:drug/metabolite transporter (DMT)-like permease
MDLVLFLVSLVSAFLIACANVIVKTNVNSLPLLSALLFRNVSMAFFTAILVFITGSQANITYSDLLYICFAGSIGYAGVCCFYKAMQITITPGLVAALSNCNGLMVLLFGVFFGFPIYLNSLPGVLVVTLGLIITSVDLKGIKDSSLFTAKSGIPLTLLVLVFFGISFNMLGIISTKLNAFYVFFLVTLVETSISILSLVLTRSGIVFPSKSSTSSIFLYGWFITLGFGGQLFAMSHANPGLVSSIISSATVFSILIARVVLNEKLSKQKYIGVILVFCGLVLINLLK